MEFIVMYDVLVRLAAFGGVFAVMAGLEWQFPRRHLSLSRQSRWVTNFMLLGVDVVVLRIVVPVLAIGLAAVNEVTGIGILPWLGLGGWPAFVVAILALDLVLYGQHVAFHLVPVLWRFHRVHHVDRDVDASTGVRFHPGEIVISACIKFSAVALLGAPVAAVIAFEALTNASAMFNHANLSLPARLDRLLRLVVVTPDMHRVHHSTLRRETDSNFGPTLSVWDRVLGTYRAQPKAGHLDMKIGLPEFQEGAPPNGGRLLVLPFLRTGS